MNMRVVEPSFSMRTDGQTDMTKLIVAFRNFVIAPEVTEYERVILVVVITMPHVFNGAGTSP